MTGQQMVQMDQISGQLAQAQQAAQRYHCTGGFLFFGPRPSPQCPAIMGQVNRLSRQLSQLRGNNFDLFFGNSPQAEAARLRDELATNGCAVPVAGGTRTLCVRVCDGYYFPIEFNAAEQPLRHRCRRLPVHVCRGRPGRVVRAGQWRRRRQRHLALRPALRRPALCLCLSPGLRPGLRRPVARRHVGIGQALFRLASAPPQDRRGPAQARADPADTPALSGRPRDAGQRRRPFHRQAGGARRGGGRCAGRTSAKPVRMVGPAYYADMFDMSKARRSRNRCARASRSSAPPPRRKRPSRR